MAESTGTSHRAVTPDGHPFADAYFNYEAHDRWVREGYCPVVSTGKTWCNLKRDHWGDHGSPLVKSIGYEMTKRGPVRRVNTGWESWQQ